jgi:hypothetical protein
VRPHLDRLSAAVRYDLRLLQDAFADWKESGPADREAYTARRRELVKRVGGCYFDAARTVTTSGTTGGGRKTYRWGPCYDAMHAFFEWLKFGWFSPRWVFYLKPQPGGEVGAYDWAGSGSKIITLDPDRPERDGPAVERLVGRDRTVLWVVPTYARLLIDRGFPFHRFDPARTVIYATGERTDPAVRDHFRSLGFHYLDGMRSWMGGATFVTCQFGATHWIDLVAHTESRPDGELVTTDLFNLAQPFLGYETLDYVRWSNGPTCRCGLTAHGVEFLERDVRVAVGRTVLGYLDLVHQAARAAALASDRPDPILYCSFGLHRRTNTLFVLYETARGATVAPTAWPAFAAAAGLTGFRVVPVPGLRGGLFKAARMFEATDDEFRRWIGSDPGAL